MWEKKTATSQWLVTEMKRIEQLSHVELLEEINGIMTACAYPWDAIGYELGLQRLNEDLECEWKKLSDLRRDWQSLGLGGSDLGHSVKRGLCVEILKDLKLIPVVARLGIEGITTNMDEISEQSLWRRILRKWQQEDYRELLDFEPNAEPCGLLKRMSRSILLKNR